MNFFKRDVIILLLISILLGTIAAKALSYGANIYFQQTLVSLVGDYGEYDLILQIREDYKEEGRMQLETLLQENFSGASYKAGPAIIGKANFFIALPEERKNQAVYENIDRLFSSVPGVSGVSILTEPRLNIRGIPPGAAGTLEEEFKRIDGVDFVYRSGGAIGIVLHGIDKIEAVTNQVEGALTKNKIIDISFPVGIEPDNPVMLAETISREIYRQLQPQTAQYVSVDTSGDDMVHLVSTMQEIRRFLLSYATKVNIIPKQKGSLAVGDKLVFQGGEVETIADGDEVKQGNIVVVLTQTNKNGSLGGIITQGDALYFQHKNGFLLKEGRASDVVGEASVDNPRLLLVQALTESAALMEKMPALAKEGNLVSARVQNTLSGYAGNANMIQLTIEQMDQAVRTMQNATDRLENANVHGLRSQLAQSSKSMSGLLNGLRLVRIFNPDVANVMQTLESTQEKMKGFTVLLEGMDGITEEAVQAKNTLVNLAKDSKSVVEALQKFSGSKAESDLLTVNRQLNEMAQSDFQKFAQQLRHLAEQAPQLSDEEIYRSVQLMDKVIEGQVIPGKRLQIMVDRQLWLDQAKPIVYTALGHENVSVYETDLGVIEPNIYLQVYQVLKEVQAVLAGFTSVVLTVLFLALDHTSVMSVLRRERIRKTAQPNPVKLLERLQEAWRGVFAIENKYGMGVGMVMLSMMFFLSGAGIPYVPWYIIPIIGMMLGFGIAQVTEKITPVSVDEILAGQSLGMSFDEIMREIVIPNARPGILQRLNRRQIYFK